MDGLSPPGSQVFFSCHDCLSLRALQDPSVLYWRIRGSRARTLALSKLKEVERCHASSVSALDVSQGDGRYLLSGGGDGSVVVHGLAKVSATVQQTYSVLGKISANSRYSHEYAISACQFYPPDPGCFCTSGKDGSVKVWDTHRMTPVHKFPFPSPVIDHHMSLLSSAKPLIAAACMDKTTRICDLRTLSSVQTLSGHSRPVNCTRWSRHGPFVLATGGVDGKIALWDIRKARSCLGYLDANNNPTTAANADAINVAHDSAVISIEFAEDAKHLISFGADQRMRLWSTVSGKNTNVNYGKIGFAFRDLHRHLQICVSSLARPDLIFVPSGDKVLAFDMHSGERISTLSAHFGQVMACAYHPNYQFLFSGATDRNILLWAPSSDHKEFEENLEINKQQQLEKSTERLRSRAVEHDDVKKDTWSDEEN